MLRATMIFAALLCAAPVLIGPALADARVVVPAHDIPRGVTISDSDLTYAMAAQPQAGVVLSMNDLSGMETRRYLRAGETVRLDDVRKPIVVTKGSLVTMTFNAPGISLTATGKAMSEGGVGESVTILNPISYRQITCTVTGPGTVAAQNNAVAMPSVIAANTIH